MSDTPQPSSKRPSPAILLFLIMPILGIAAALIMILQNERQNSTEDILDLPAYMERQAAALMNYTAPQFTVTDLDGQTVSLSDYQGRIVFLNFWTTDCPPCQREMPAFETFSAEQGETGAAILTVNMGDSAEMIQDFFARLDVSGVRVAMDTTLDVGRQYGIMARPVTYVIDKEGVIRAMKAGEVTIEMLDDYVVQLDSNDAAQAADPS